VRRQYFLALFCGTLIPLSHALGQTTATDSAPLLHTGITGVKRATGLSDPTFVLRLRPVQHVVLDAVAAPVSAPHIDSLLQGAPVSRADLVTLGILRPQGALYAIAYLVLTADDQRAIYSAAQTYGPSLARAYESHRAEFDRLFTRYHRAALRPDLAFAVIAGMSLNWDGLKLTTELNYRVAPTHYPNGDAYLFHSNQPGANNPGDGVYSESHSLPGPQMTFTTFGDGPSIPRLHGIPDVFDGPIEDGLAFLKNDAAAYGAVQGELIAYIEEATADAGRIMTALAAAPLTEPVLRARVQISATRFDASLKFLESLGYIRKTGDAESTRKTGETESTRKTGDTYDVAVPVLTPRDKPMLDSTLALSRRIMTEWLAANHASMEHDLSGLSSVRDGLPFAAPFSEIWHYVFGTATKSLAADGFFADPRAPNHPDTGYVPLVWATSLYHL
jgi:hypothetical protein